VRASGGALGVVSARRYVFLDRDGTLVADPGYVHRIEDYALLPGVPEALHELCAAGFRLAIVTNQSGIGRGYYGMAEFERFQARLLADLGRAGVNVDATYLCPHVPGDGCACRKPAPALLERARTELDADLEQSWVIGDAQSDVELAARAGCRAVWLAPPGAPPPDPRPFATARDLCEAARVILASPRRTEPRPARAG
jgi:D-glycero-D-manno-heptose 1,7-bisphosphate phosphatase